ncbi:unnamed protein product, partial [Tetraodon nigroviridis]
QPPTIVKQSVKDYIVDPRDNIIIECEAKGNPVPDFSWRRNGKFFNLGKDPRVATQKDSGTLEINFRSGGKQEDYEGEYQCFASNELGVALSNKILLRVSSEDTLLNTCRFSHSSVVSDCFCATTLEAPLWPKEVLDPVLVTEGSSLILPCNPPPGLPPPLIFWMDSTMTPIVQDKRVSMGLNGDLYFSNVMAKDAHNEYKCNARCRLTQTIQQKNPFILKVHTKEPFNDTSHNDTDPYGEDEEDARGQISQISPLIVKRASVHPVRCCGGKERPDQDGLDMPREGLVNKMVERYLESNSQAEDPEEGLMDGCGRSRKLPQTMPTLLSPTGSQSSKMVLRGQQLLLECIAAGVPTPTIKWYRKGGDLPERKVKFENFNKTLLVVGVSEEDAGEYVCMAINHQGSIRHSILVQVKAAPYWLDKPTNLVLAPNENGRLVCRANGNPKPNIQWLINGQPIESSPQNPSRDVLGDTIIFRSVQMGSSAVYQCNASNQYGYLLSNAFVSVLDMPPRMLGPKNQLIKVIENNHTFLDCPFFGSPLPDLRWFKNGQGSGVDGGHYSVHNNGTLEIKRARSEDEGTYTCVASSLLGKAENQVRLEVKEEASLNPSVSSALPPDRPDPPLELDLSDPAVRSVRLTWIPGNDNRSPVTHFLVQFEEDRWEPGRWRNLSSYPGHLNSVILQLAPFVNYQFRVIAINSVGQSEPSLPSPQYKTSGAAPDVIPRGLRGWGSMKGNMEITWEPLLDLERNGANLYYSVWWKRKDTSEDWNNVTTVRTKHVVHNTETYVPYQIKIQAGNEFGSGPESNIIIGYSGEDTPTDAPTELRVSRVDTNRAHIHWKSVDLKSVQGEFKEYRVRQRHTEFIIAVCWSFPKIVCCSSPQLYYWRDSSLVPGLAVNKEKQTKGFYSTVSEPSTLLSELVPFSKYKMFMVVANTHYEGPPSNTVEFTTKEGVPDAPRFFTINRKNVDTVHLEWGKPLEPNGILIGYQLKYQTVNGSTVGRAQFETFLPNVTEFTLRLPDRAARYKFYLSAVTQVGSGEVFAKEMPRFANEVTPGREIWNVTVEPNSNYANISWKHNFPASSSEFVLEFTLDSDKTVKAITVKQQPPITVADLIAGATYHLRVYSHELNSISSKSFSFKTKPAYIDQVDIATQGWFIGLMCAIALIILILLIVCFIKRSRGGKYPVREKKDLPLDPVDQKDQDGSFDYHSDEDNKPLQGSQTSLDANVKESDDSLVDYGEGGDGQFNEDGSFIGQYTVKKDKDETEGNESSEATSPVNAIYSLA